MSQKFGNVRDSFLPLLKPALLFSLPK